MESGIPHTPLPHLIRAVWLQLLRRKDIYLLAFFMLLFACGASLARILGVNSPQMARFVASLGYTLASTLSALVVILFGASQLPAEIESRTIYPVLAGPVERGHVIWGKFLPLFLAAAAMLIFCSLVTWLVAPRLPLQLHLALLQAMALKLAALAALAMMVLAISLWAPTSITIIVSLTLYFAGGAIISIARHAAGEGAAAALALRLVPDFSLLEHFDRYVEGAGLLSSGEFLAAIAYGLIWFIIMKTIAQRSFQDKPL